MTQAVPRRSSLLSLLFGFATRVDRRTYVISGVLLMLAKYTLDATRGLGGHRRVVVAMALSLTGLERADGTVPARARARCCWVSA